MRHVGMCSWESKARGEGSYPPPSFPGADDFFMTAIKKAAPNVQRSLFVLRTPRPAVMPRLFDCLAARPLRSITSKKTGSPIHPSREPGRHAAARAAHTASFSLRS